MIRGKSIPYSTGYRTRTITSIFRFFTQKLDNIFWSTQARRFNGNSDFRFRAQNRNKLQFLFWTSLTFSFFASDSI